MREGLFAHVWHMLTKGHASEQRLCTTPDNVGYSEVKRSVEVGASRPGLCVGVLEILYSVASRLGLDYPPTADDQPRHAICTLRVTGTFVSLRVSRDRVEIEEPNDCN